MKTLTIFVLILTFPLLLNSQKGFQLGLGLDYNVVNIHSGKYQNGSKINISNLYGFSLNLDYSFNSKFRLKSGLEYKSQNIKFENLTNYRAEYLSIPIVFNYNFIQLEKSGLSFGVDAGISLDKPVYKDLFFQSGIASNSSSLKTVTTLTIDPNGLPSRVFEFSDYLSFRFGVSAKYNMGKRGQLNFFGNVILRGFEDVIPFTTNKKVLDNGAEISNDTYQNNLSISNKGFQFGVYYTFGTLTFK
ncbi:MAG: outer membrane beta-barrel protein [Saprospiraceae bacterium]|jgi:hypothetical protein